MAGIGEDTSTSFNLNFGAGGGDGIKNVAAQYRQLSDSLKLTKVELQEAGVRGSALMKTLADTKALTEGAAKSFKVYQDTVKKFGADSVAAGAAARNLARDIKYLSQEEGMLKMTAADAAAAIRRQKDILAQTSAEDAWIAKQKQMTGAGAGVVSQIKGMVLQYVGLYAILSQVKAAFTAASDFDQQLDRLAVSSGKTGEGFMRASEGLHQLALSTSQGTIFAEDKVLGAMTKFRDRGFDVFSMTKEQLMPVLDAATATMQDLGDVADATAVTLNQFGLSIDRTGEVANVMGAAFRAAGLTAQEFQEGITAAGGAAVLAGQDLASYTAVLVRLKQLGLTSGAQFQKLFFAGLENPSAKQLQAWQRSGVNPYLSPDAGSAIGEAGRRAKGALSGMSLTDPGSIIRSVSSAAGEIGQVANIQANAKAWEDARMQLVALANEQDRVNGQITVYGTLVNATQADLGQLKEAQGSWKEKLDETTKSLADVTKEIDGLTGVALPGMHEFDLRIEQAEMAAKKAQLQMLQNEESTRAYEQSIRSLNDQIHDQERSTERMRRSYEDVGAALEKAKTKASGLEAALQKLRNPELAGERAFDDKAFGIQQQIAALNLRKSKLSPVDLFGANQIDQQVAALQRQLEQTNLERSVTFDPQKRAIEQAAHASDIRTGKADAPTTAEDAISRIDSLTDRYLRQQKKVTDLTRERQREARALQASQDATQALKDRVEEVTDAMERAKRATQDQADALKTLQRASDELKLEKEVRYGEQLFQIKEAQRALKEELGLTAKEQPFSEIMARIPALGRQYQDLSKERDFDREQVRKYDEQVRSSEAVLKIYQSKLDDAKASSDRLKDATKDLEERSAGLTKPLRDQVDIFTDLANARTGLGDLYDMIGKRGGAAMAALIGPDGKNVDKLRELRDLLKAPDDVSNTAADVTNDVYGAMEKVAAQLKNLQIEMGTKLADSMTGLMGAITRLTDVIIGWLGDKNQSIPSHIVESIPGVGSAIKRLAEAAPNYNPGDFLKDLIFPGASAIHLASGGIVPGTGTRDTVPAMLTPGEEVLPASSPRHIRNGGGATVIFNGDVHVRSEQDIDRLASAISRKLATEARNTRAGMAA